jgi:hypothetical protein
MAMVTRLVALITRRLGIEPVTTPGKIGQFEVIVDGNTIAQRGGNWFTRSLGAGYPDLDRVVEELERRQVGFGDGSGGKSQP